MREGNTKEGEMRYTVNIFDATDHLVAMICDCSTRQAIKIAEKEARQNPNCLVFVDFFRVADGQHGYLNDNGNHAITGMAWGRGLRR